MADHISISDSYWLTGKFLAVVRRLADCKGDLGIIKEAMEEMIDGTDYTDLEQKLGLQAGDGELVYNLTAGVVAGLDSSAAQQFIARLLQ